MLTAANASPPETATGIRLAVLVPPAHRATARPGAARLRGSGVVAAARALRRARVRAGEGARCLSVPVLVPPPLAPAPFAPAIRGAARRDPASVKTASTDRRE